MATSQVILTSLPQCVRRHTLATLTLSQRVNNQTVAHDLLNCSEPASASTYSRLLTSLSVRDTARPNFRYLSTEKLSLPPSNENIVLCHRTKISPHAVELLRDPTSLLLAVCAGTDDVGARPVACFSHTFCITTSDFDASDRFQQHQFARKRIDRRCYYSLGSLAILDLPWHNSLRPACSEA